MKQYQYILIDREPVEASMDVWVNWMQTCPKDRLLAKAFYRHPKNDDNIGPYVDIEVSTVFLTCDHSFGGKGGPVLFETMTFGMEEEGEDWQNGFWGNNMTRYHTYDEAMDGHRLSVAVVELFLEKLRESDTELKS